MRVLFVISSSFRTIESRTLEVNGIRWYYIDINGFNLSKWIESGCAFQQITECLQYLTAIGSTSHLRLSARYARHCTR